MNYLSLFSGLGGIDLGLDRAGMTCVGQVEIDPFCRKVLAKHWPEVPRHDDVRTAPGWWLGTTRPAVDLVCGGFPCQPFSTAGRRAGIADERWGWPWFWDVVSALRPRYVLVENVAALLRDADAFAWLLSDLAEGGYDADWDCIPAAAVGAPHRRDRLFIVAYSRSERRREGEGWSGRPTGNGENRPGFTPEELADASGQGRAGSVNTVHRRRAGALGRRQTVLGGCGSPERFAWWDVESDLGGSLDGFSAWLDRSGHLDESHKLLLAYANESGQPAAEDLRTLRDALRAEDRQRPAGGCGGLSAQEVLLAYLRQLADHCDARHASSAGAGAPQAGVRGVRNDGGVACPPLRRESGEQRLGEPANALHALSRLLAPHAEKAWIAYRRSDAAPDLGWEDGLARIAPGVPNRVDRLIALGNAVVPQVAEHVGRLILHHAQAVAA